MKESKKKMRLFFNQDSPSERRYKSNNESKMSPDNKIASSA
jgi:hypothetical protein